MDNNSLSHTKWGCKYSIVFALKFRRKIIYKQIRADIGYKDIGYKDIVFIF